MKPLEIRPTKMEGYITLIYPEVMLTVPSTFPNDLKFALEGENPGLKELAEEIVEETEKESDGDPDLVMHLIYAFMALKIRLCPPPVQLELFDKETLQEDLPPEMEELNEALKVLRKNTEDTNEMIMDKLIEAPEKYKKEKAEFIRKMAMARSMNPLRTLIWTALVVGLGLYLIFNWGNAHWGLITAEVLLVMCSKIILFDDPKGENLYDS
jgi:hypothetical protein